MLKGWGFRGFGAVFGADSELGEVRHRYLYRYVCMFNVHIDRLPGPLATMISPPSSVLPPHPSCRIDSKAYSELANCRISLLFMSI